MIWGLPIAPALLGQIAAAAAAAAVLAYITTQILRTVAAIDREAEAEAKAARNRPVRVVWDMAEAQELARSDAGASA